MLCCFFFFPTRHSILDKKRVLYYRYANLINWERKGNFKNLHIWFICIENGVVSSTHSRTHASMCIQEKRYIQSNANISLVSQIPFGGCNIDGSSKFSLPCYAIKTPISIEIENNRTECITCKQSVVYVNVKTV